MSATGARSELGERLRAHRQAANLTGTRMGELMGHSQTWVSKVENGKARISPEQVEVWLKHASASEQVRRDLVDLAERADAEFIAWKKLEAQGWATHQKRYEDIEREAETVRLYSVSSIPGLLQTPGYTDYQQRKVLGRPPEAVAAVIAGRAARQQLLYRPTSRFQVVLAEQVIRHCFGGLGVMTEQLRRLADLAKLPTLDLRIIPINNRMEVPYGTGFDLFEYPEEGESVVHFELSDGERVEQDPKEVAKVRARFDHYQVVAIRGNEVIAMIEQVAAEMTASIFQKEEGGER